MGDDDPIARLRAEMDQAREGMKEIAGNMWSFYSEAVERGFNEDQAFTLTLTLLSSMVQSGGDDE